MKRLTLVSAAFLAAMAIAPGLAQARTHHQVRLYWLPYELSFSHNYGPGRLPGTFAHYDGPSTNFCAQSAATYIGQDRRKHPCF
jgi:hypothetical protein